MMEKFKSREKSFDSKKTAYFSKFALAHMPQMRILKEGGILGKENSDWRNVSEHCLVEAVGADILAEHLNADRQTVVQGVLLHDWYKRHEIGARREHGAVAGFALSSAEDPAQLKELGVSENIIRIAHANIPESDDPEYLEQRPLEDKIMHYMDMITDQSDFIEAEERLRKTESNPATMQFLESFRDKYHGRHLNELQREVAKLEQKEFEKKLGLGEGKLIEFLKTTLHQRIEASIA